MGVFATRSPYRPNPLGLSCVRIEGIDRAEGLLHVLGADLADGTPIFDIKPYVAYCDSHPDARCGFVDANAWDELEVEWPAELAETLAQADRDAITQLLRQDPRPQYQTDPERRYGIVYSGMDIRFRVDGRKLRVVEIVPAA